MPAATGNLVATAEAAGRKQAELVQEVTAETAETAGMAVVDVAVTAPRSHSSAQHLSSTRRAKRRQARPAMVVLEEVAPLL